MSTSLYNTFGNEVKYQYIQDTLVQYLENATIKFPLPEASSEILGELADTKAINPVELETVQGRLVSIGFGEPNARAMAAVLISVAKDQGISPMEYFSVNEASLKLTIDTYEAMNLIRPKGNRVGLSPIISNKRSRHAKLIRP